MGKQSFKKMIYDNLHRAFRRFFDPTFNIFVSISGGSSALPWITTEGPARTVNTSYIHPWFYGDDINVKILNHPCTHNFLNKHLTT